MGNITSRLETHRFLGQAICHSTTVDPRHLEHLTYTHWTGDIAALIIDGGLKFSLIAPQFPIYISPKEPSLGPDSSSGVTETDGEARGVYVDIAIVTPILKTRYLEEIRSIANIVEGSSVQEFFDRVLPKHPGLSPRCLWVSGFEAPLLAELKHGPTRHPQTPLQFYTNLLNLITAAMQQVHRQAICLFCSWRFGTQDNVILLAGAGDYYSLRWVNRKWAVNELKGKEYLPNNLKMFKNPYWIDKELDKADNHDADDDWTEGKEADMYGSPLDASKRQQKLNSERRKAESIQVKFMAALSTSPNNDYAAPLFRDADLDHIHQQKTASDVPLFETRGAQVFLNSPGGWSGILRLGSNLSNQYMDRVKQLIKGHEMEEQKRREEDIFRWGYSHSV
ncbi:hypothetical protein GGX14DRAFT_374853 [Mycena pura]|uniref:Uncharacterized protein n=1 Tax=Mycena pura TaxID=153505 RepID=A0AAD6V1X5_9AGAR|nr:hypothetical protein GGX14DRAFT_374853 [Mycena pura]